MEEQQAQEEPSQDRTLTPEDKSSTEQLIADGRNNAKVERSVQRRHSNLPNRGLPSGRFSMRIPANHDAAYTAAETHGYDHWKVKILHFIHSDKVELVLMGMLIADVVILFIELFLQAYYPLCHIVERDAISCCPVDTMNATMTTTSHETNEEHFLRFLAEDDVHHNLCEYPSVESHDYEATCDPHRHENVHHVEKVLFILTIIILSTFVLELTIVMLILQKAFFRQFFYVLDLFIVATSLGLEILFHFLHEELLVTLSGLLIFGRVWRFVRIGHGLVEVTAEYGHRDKEALMEYAETLEQILQENELALPEVTKRVRHIKKEIAKERNVSGHSVKKSTSHNHSGKGSSHDSATPSSKKNDDDEASGDA